MPLEGWEKRPRLRDDPAAIRALLGTLEKGGYDLLTSEWVAILDALDALLFGSAAAQAASRDKEADR